MMEGGQLKHLRERKKERAKARIEWEKTDLSFEEMLMEICNFFRITELNGITKQMSLARVTFLLVGSKNN